MAFVAGFGRVPLVLSAYIFVDEISQRQKATRLSAGLVPYVQGRLWHLNLNVTISGQSQRSLAHSGFPFCRLSDSLFRHYHTTFGLSARLESPHGFCRWFWARPLVLSAYIFVDEISQRRLGKATRLGARLVHGKLPGDLNKIVDIDIFTRLEPEYLGQPALDEMKELGPTLNFRFYGEDDIVTTESQHIKTINAVYLTRTVSQRALIVTITFLAYQDVTLPFSYEHIAVCSNTIGISATL
ncbi:uncharacterized protein EDB93DRAFT_875506 [Suillus bovinus]|uniref:uncharacterized protein n=1 Tax=Suillus bovinus TaxID=48563 RepID=UPI001B8678C2|nr:uncharacterized protein EDB93DRAFT_875506 [Suillus bovinus]KAG2156903.1 hypothetical protein EDB93DRAFT_875506 [Suillus bovinus]